MIYVVNLTESVRSGNKNLDSSTTPIFASKDFAEAEKVLRDKEQECYNKFLKEVEDPREIHGASFKGEDENDETSFYMYVEYRACYGIIQKCEYKEESECQKNQQ